MLADHVGSVAAEGTASGRDSASCRGCSERWNVWSGARSKVGSCRIVVHEEVWEECARELSRWVREWTA